MGIQVGNIRKTVALAAATAGLVLGGAGFASAADAGSSSVNPGAVASGNNVNPVVQAPVLGCGNTVALGGVGSSSCGGAGAMNASTAHAGSSSVNNGSTLGGNNVNAGINAPVSLCGNAAGLFGLSRASC